MICFHLNKQELFFKKVIKWKIDTKNAKTLQAEAQLQRTSRKTKALKHIGDTIFLTTDFCSVVWSSFSKHLEVIWINCHGLFCRDLLSFISLTSPCPVWKLCYRQSHRNWRRRGEAVMEDHGDESSPITSSWLWMNDDWGRRWWRSRATSAQRRKSEITCMFVGFYLLVIFSLYWSYRTKC